ncbi:hypothetical protein Ancab_028091 [Ancistrocladus abbreviatus]
MAFSRGGRFQELLKKYGKVALGVHLSVSAASITGLYIAIKNNVDIESMLEKVGMGAAKDETRQMEQQQTITSDGDFVTEDRVQQQFGFPGDQPKKRNRTAELAASSGGALALAVLCNKALFPIRVPITVALTPPIARFFARRNMFKHSILVKLLLRVFRMDLRLCLWCSFYSVYELLSFARLCKDCYGCLVEPQMASRI